MVNHAYTLLANLAPLVTPDPWEEVIDPSFQPLDALPGPITTLRRILFGERTDRLFAAYRTSQLLAFLQAGPCPEYLTALDPRTTYQTQCRLGDFPTATEVAQVLGLAARAAVAVDPPAQPFDSVGLYRVVTQVDFTWSGGNRIWDATALVPYLPTTVQATNEPPIQPFTRQRLRFSGIFDATTSGSRFQVVHYLRPGWGPGEWLTRLETAGAMALRSVLDLHASSEPGATFEKIWRTGPDIVSRLSGVLYGLIWALDREWRKTRAQV